jgi:Domain of unknown function (DUF5658)
MLSRYLFRGRRRGERRAALTHDVYVDRPGAWLISACVLLVAMSVADAYLTLLIIEEGGAEINPYMRAVLDLGQRPFLIVKIGLTVVGTTVLLLHKTWRLGRIALWIALGGYGLLTVYHVVVYVTRRLAE